ncbi:MAG: aminotransferase class III-fold pyridoxal phosphate-dependent enzyme [Oscillospiraceae bacterium]|nr:aminotransferase class III-fold pyridoxal phosphate-dependent enzyme [Oscillospiraceae bacterium]
MSERGDAIKQKQITYNLQSWSKQKGINPLPVERAEGLYLYDYDGKRYADMSSMLVNVNLGHQNPVIVNAIKENADKICYLSPPYAVESRANLAEKVIGLMPDNFGKVFITSTGTEAVENAVKIARMASGKQKFFSRYRSYHGSTYAGANLTGEPRRFPSEPGIPGFIKFGDAYLYRAPVPFESDIAAGEYYLRMLEEQILMEGCDNIAAIFMESVPGTNGIMIPPANYLPGIRTLCDKYGIFMVMDEVMAGFGRTGKMFGFEHWGIKPDMVTFAKGVTCGYVQLGGVAVSKKIAEHFDDNALLCGHTYAAHPLGCAVGCATIDYYFEHKVLENVNKVGKVLGELHEGLKAKYDCVGDVRYIGLFSCVELVKSKTTKEPLVPFRGDKDGIMPKILGELRARGFLTYTYENMVFVSPPLTITEEQLREEYPKLDEVIGIVQEKYAK